MSHRAARDADGLTACVMPCGLDRPLPPENRPLWREFLNYPGAVLVSEFPFGTAASALTLSKRNKTIVGLSHRALIGQASATGGAMYAFRFAQEQHKPVATFAADGQPSLKTGLQLLTQDTSLDFSCRWGWGALNRESR